MKDESKDKLSAAKGTLTVRHLPADVDAAITAQAKAAGRSKSDFIQEFLSASFGDIIGNFSRSSELVALMDRELSGVTGLPLTENWTLCAFSSSSSGFSNASARSRAI